MKQTTTTRPILFTSDMVRAILDGRKTQSRRLIKPQPVLYPTGWQYGKNYKNSCSPAAGPATDVLYPYECPYGKPGDHFYVRETWAHVDGAIVYRADFGPEPVEWNWRPSIHMPRAAARLILEITDVRVERLQDITEADAAAEGVENADSFCGIGVDDEKANRYAYRELWEKINGPHSWHLNPWVWAITFTPI